MHSIVLRNIMLHGILVLITLFIASSCAYRDSEANTKRQLDSLRQADSLKLVREAAIRDSLRTANAVDTMVITGLQQSARIIENVNNPKSVIISPNGRHAYVNNLEGMNTMIINTSTYEVESVIEHTGKPVEFAFTQKGKYVWISYFRLLEKGYPRELGVERNYNHPSVVVVYDTLEKALTHRIDVGVIPKVISVSPDESIAAVANWNSDDISIIRTDNMEVVKTIKVGLIPRGMEFTPNGEYLYVCNFGSSTLSKINVLALEVESTIKNVGYKPRDIVITKDGKLAYFSCFGDGLMRKLDLTTDEVVNKIRIGNEPRSVCMTRNNKYLFVVNYQSESVDMIDLETFEKVFSQPTDHGSVGVALSPDMKFLWVTNQDTGSIQVFEILYI
jgi:YVTN family beta-propeller protein